MGFRAWTLHRYLNSFIPSQQTLRNGDSVLTQGLEVRICRSP